MKKEEILKELKDIMKDYSLPKLIKLVENLESDVKKENFIQKPSDKRRLKVIEKILNYSKKVGCRPLLGGYTFLNNQVAFTDSYQLYLLNDEYLPFDIAMTNDNEEKVKEIANKYELNILSGVYPNLKNVIPQEEPLSKFTININDFLAYIKSTPKDKKDCIIYTIDTELGEISFNGLYLKNVIDILKLDSDFELELYGDIKPIIIHNKDDELGLILPIKKY